MKINKLQYFLIISLMSSFGCATVKHQDAPATNGLSNLSPRQIKELEKIGITDSNALEKTKAMMISEKYADSNDVQVVIDYLYDKRNGELVNVTAVEMRDKRLLRSGQMDPPVKVLAKPPAEISNFKSKLRPCTGNDYEKWNNCIGAVDIPEKNNSGKSRTRGTYGEAGIYYGEWSNGAPHGKGIKLFTETTNKKKYEGEFDNWNPINKGTFTLEINMSFYKGETFKDETKASQGDFLLLVKDSNKIQKNEKYTAVYRNNELVAGTIIDRINNDNKQSEQKYLSSLAGMKFLFFCSDEMAAQGVSTFKAKNILNAIMSDGLSYGYDVMQAYGSCIPKSGVVPSQLLNKADLYGEKNAKYYIIDLGNNNTAAAIVE